MSLSSGSMRGGRGRKFKSEINVVPYIDVMLVLLIIFMVSAPMKDPGEIKLPNAAQTTQPPTEYIRIDLKPDASATLVVSGGKRRRIEGHCCKPKRAGAKTARAACRQSRYACHDRR
jgi:biopolymer transport protein TolR